ncbi:hypothetical protein [Escherichia coli]
MSDSLGDQHYLMVFSAQGMNAEDTVTEIKPVAYRNVVADDFLQ